MLFFGGAALIFISIMMFIKFLVASSRPKAELPIKEYVFQQLKSDLFGFGGQQKHAKVIINANGQDHEALVLVGKTINIPIGGNIKVSYKASNPKEARYHNPKKELLMTSVMFVIGAALVIAALVISDLIS